MDSFLIPSVWETLSIFCKLSVYFGLASIAGGSLFLVAYSDGSRQTTTRILIYSGVGAFVGFQGSIVSFLAQIGQINGAGFSGMFDLAMSQMLIDTQLGDATLYRLLGFGAAFLVNLWAVWALQKVSVSPSKLFYRRLFTLNCFALMSLSLSFRLIGHVSVLSTLAQLAIAVHVVAFGFWIGILYPLTVLINVPKVEFVQAKLRLFGQHAIFLVALLISAGGLLVLELFQSWEELFGSAYGLSVLAKIALVIGILAIAAINKLKLVPNLTGERGVAAFRRSLRVEAVFAVLILSVTAYFSTVIGPMSMDH
ncbi:MAG: copper resistance D family protein [Pseudohongiellaceae bacterium]